MSQNDSRELTGDETIEELTVKQIIGRYKEESISVIIGDRYTPVHGWGTEGERRDRVLFDCYGQPIDSGASPKHVYRVVVR